MESRSGLDHIPGPTAAELDAGRAVAPREPRSSAPKRSSLIGGEPGLGGTQAGGGSGG